PTRHADEDDWVGTDRGQADRSANLSITVCAYWSRVGRPGHDTTADEACSHFRDRPCGPRIRQDEAVQDHLDGTVLVNLRLASPVDRPGAATSRDAGNRWSRNRTKRLKVGVRQDLWRSVRWQRQRSYAGQDGDDNKCKLTQR